jgi:hypothetical protein
MVDNNGLVMAVTTSTANCHDNKPLLGFLEKANTERKLVSMPTRPIAVKNIAML